MKMLHSDIIVITLYAWRNGMKIIIKSIETAGYVPGKDVFIAFDIAALFVD